MINMAEEIRLIRWTENWPLWPILPMKNRRLVPPGHMPETGFILSFDVEANAPVVYIGASPFGSYTKEQLEALPRMPFESIDELVAAGWIGD